MRVTVSHDKGQKEGIRIVDETANKLLRTDAPGPLKITHVRKEWLGASLNFSAHASVGPIGVPVRGIITVLSKEIVIEVDLPPLLTKIVPEKKIESAFRTRVRGLLKG